MTHSQLSFIRRALDSSSKSDCDIKHGAVLTCGGKILAIGRNRHKYNPAFSGYTIHAEVDAILSYLTRRDPRSKLYGKDR